MNKQPVIQDLPLDTDKANLAKITLSGRYPEKGYALNTVSEMVVYIQEGTVVLEREDGKDILATESAVLVNTGTKYCWKPQTKATLLIFSAPPWTKEQQKVIE